MTDAELDELERTFSAIEERRADVVWAPAAGRVLTLIAEVRRLRGAVSAHEEVQRITDGLAGHVEKQMLREGVARLRLAERVAEAVTRYDVVCRVSKGAGQRQEELDAALEAWRSAR